MSVTHICENNYLSWPSALHQVGWLRCPSPVEYRNELIREQMLKDQKKNLRTIDSISLPSVSFSDLRDSPSLMTTSRLACHFYITGSALLMQALKVTDEEQVLVSCCVGAGRGHGVCGGCRWVWKAPAVTVISLSCPLEPLHALSALGCFSHCLIRGVKGPGCLYPLRFLFLFFFLMKASMVVCTWQSLILLQGKGFHFLSESWRSGHWGSPKFFVQWTNDPQY